MLLIGLMAAALQVSPAPALREPLIYFGFDSAEPLPTSSAALASVIEHSLRGPARTITITITSHTDTAGPASYNLELSRRRAQAIRDRLVAAGVSSENIALRPMGEEKLARRTTDNAVEPLNRRAWVDISW